MVRSCSFCEIIAGSRTAHVVLENPWSLAFLDIRPLFPGHVLLVPKVHYETLADLPRIDVGLLFTDAQTIEKVVVEVMGAEGSFVALNNRVSQSVPHLHIHVVPRSRGDGLKGFFWPRVGYRDPAHLEEVCRMIRMGLQSR